MSPEDEQRWALKRSARMAVTGYVLFLLLVWVLKCLFACAPQNDTEFCRSLVRISHHCEERKAGRCVRTTENTFSPHAHQLLAQCEDNQ